MSLSTLFLIPAAILIGITLGGLGSGGSILTLPALVYLGGVDPKSAVGMSLAIVGATSFAGSLAYFARGDLSVSRVLTFAGTGAVGSYFGSGATRLVSSGTLMLIFAGILIAVGSSILLTQRREAHVRNWPLCIIAGLLIGMLTGFLGVGGFLLVPALLRFGGIDTRTATGTSLGVITVNSASGFVGHLRHAQLDWTLMLTFIALSLAGLAVGLRIARMVREDRLRRVFAAFLVAVGISLAFANWPALH